MFFTLSNNEIILVYWLRGLERKMKKDKEIYISIIAIAAVVAAILVFAVFDVTGARTPAPDPVPTEEADETVLQEKQLARFVHMSENEILGEFGRPINIEEGDHTVHYTQETYPYKLVEFKDENSYSYSFMFIDGTLNNFHVSTSGTLGIPFGGDMRLFLEGLGFKVDTGMIYDRPAEGMAVCRDVNRDIEYINIEFSEDGAFVYNLFFMLDSTKF